MKIDPTSAVEVFRRTYTTVLHSSGETKLRVLETSYKLMESSLHSLVNSEELDLGAFIYASRRLPDNVAHAKLIVLGQSEELFSQNGFPVLQEWTQKSAPGRRRRWYQDNNDTLAVLIASASDVDDLLPTLVAYQIEWNKLHSKLKQLNEQMKSMNSILSPAECSKQLGGTEDDWQQLQEVWGENFADQLAYATKHPLSLRIRMLGGTQIGYSRITRRWWQQVTGLMRSEGVNDRPIYFVSSNSHSLANLLTGIAHRHQDQLTNYIDRQGPSDLREELERFRNGSAEGEFNNFLYYVVRLYRSHLPTDSKEHNNLRREEREAGIYNISSRATLDVAAQIVPLNRLNPENFDYRIGAIDLEKIQSSKALIVNIDYPLGLAAYNILREVAETVQELRGVYVLGKAATLNADVGDIMISNVIHDEHSGSTYWLDNAFQVSDIVTNLRFGSLLDRQKAVSVKGTFLQNRGYLDFYSREAFTVVEMEAGPYCNAIYELNAEGRFPTNEPVNFSNLPIDFGVIHYASDTPFTQARTLGARGLSYFGMDSTYASSIAIMRRILELENML